MGLRDIGEKIKQLVQSEVKADKNNQAFDHIQQATGVPIDDKQRAAIIKANVDPELLMAGFTIKRIKDGADSARASAILNMSQQPGGTDQLLQQNPFGLKASQGGVTLDIPGMEVEKRKSQIQSEKEIETEAGKTSKESETNLISAELKFDSIMDSFIDYSDRQREITGLDPGPLSGAVSKIINNTTRLNEFQNALQGASLEIAAASAKAALPTMRGGVQIVNLFKKGVVSEFDTLESGIVDSSKAMKSILMQDMASSPDNYIKGYSKMDQAEKGKARKKLAVMADDFEEDYKTRFIKMALKKQSASGREILKSETTQKMINKLPVFKSTKEGDASVEPGELYVVDGQLVEAS